MITSLFKLYLCVPRCVVLACHLERGDEAAIRHDVLNDVVPSQGGPIVVEWRRSPSRHTVTLLQPRVSPTKGCFLLHLARRQRRLWHGVPGER